MTSLTELLTKSLRECKTNKKCMKWMKMVMLSFLKSKRKRKIKRKLNLLKNSKNKSKIKLHNNKRNLLKDKTYNQVRAKINLKVLKPLQPNKANLLSKTKKKKKKTMKQMVTNLRSLFHQDLSKAELINLLTQSHMYHSTLQDEDYLKNINLL